MKRHLSIVGPLLGSLAFTLFSPAMQIEPAMQMLVVGLICAGFGGLAVVGLDDEARKN